MGKIIDPASRFEKVEIIPTVGPKAEFEKVEIIPTVGPKAKFSVVDTRGLEIPRDFTWERFHEAWGEDAQPNNLELGADALMPRKVDNK